MHKNINSANGQEKIEQETIPLDAESLGLVGSLPVGKEEVVACGHFMVCALAVIHLNIRQGLRAKTGRQNK